MTEQPSLLLIHGAWQGAWVWDALTPLLGQAGYTVDAPDLPATGDVSLDGYVAMLADRLPRRVVVIAHSGGGVIASQLAETRPEQVAAVIYIAGIMLPSGMGFAQLTADLLPEHPEASGIGPSLAWSPDGHVSTVPEAAACEIFLHDLPPAEAHAAARRLTPQANGGRAMTPHLTPERFGTVPRLYLEALHDRSVVLAAQRRMQALVPGAKLVSLPTGHAPHVSAPGLVADAILPWLAALGLWAK